MSAASNILSLRGAYRELALVPGQENAAQAQLSAAAEALTMALLSLGSAQDEGDAMQRIVHARGFLVEAVTALSRARLHDPRVRTHALPFLMASDARPDVELRRLHQIATRLLWQNHAYLPARLQAKPLPPEEEEALAVVFAGLARHNRIGRAMRHPWVVAGLTAAVAGPLLGAPVVGAVAGSVAVTMGMFRAARDWLGGRKNEE